MRGDSRENNTAFVPEERFLDCVHCGLCLTACPTYLESGLEAEAPRGRIYLMRALQEGTLAPSASTVRHLDLCLGCRACEPACPSGVQYGTLIEAARPAVEARYSRPWHSRIRRTAVARLVADPRGQRWLARASDLLPRPALRRLANVPSLPQVLRYRIALAASLPRSAAVPLPANLEPVGPPRGIVGLFPGCMAQRFFGTTNRRAARLLARAGFRVCTPQAPVCCGALLLHLGRKAEALSLARHVVAVFSQLPVDAIAVTAAGCGATLRSYGELLGPVGEAVASRTRDITPLLAEAGLPPPPGRVERRVTYHDACHLAHAQGERDAPRTLLHDIPGLEFVELGNADRCCGSAGTYNLTEPRMAWRLLDGKVDSILATGASTVATANPGCLVQIRAGLACRRALVNVAHPIDLLAAAHFPSPRAGGSRTPSE